MRAYIEYTLIVALLVALGGIVAYKGYDRGEEKVILAAPEIHARHNKELPEVDDMGYKLEEPIFDGGTWRGRAAIGDLNADGRADFVACNRKEDGLNVFLQQADGSFETSNEGIPDDLSYGGIALDDLDKDGDLDIIFTTHKAPVHVILNDGKAKNWTVKLDGLDNSEVTNSVDVGDLNGDGHTDIAVIGQFKGGIMVWFGDGTGQWRRDQDPNNIQAYEASGDFGRDVVIADVDADGDNDILALMDKGLRPLFNDGKGTFTLETANLPTPTIGGMWQALAVGDINGDGFPEVAVGGVEDPNRPDDPLNRGMTIFKYEKETGNWVMGGKGLEAHEAYHDCQFADLNGDGHLDLVTSSVVRKLTFWIGDGKGSFTERGRIPGASGKGFVAVGDITGNGSYDFILTTYNRGVDFVTTKK